MSVNPQMMAQMLMMQQGQQGQPAPQGMGVPGQAVPKQGAASTAMQGGNDYLKMMMLQNMMKPQNQQQGSLMQQYQANAMLPKTNQMIQNDPSITAPPQMPPMTSLSGGNF